MIFFDNMRNEVDTLLHNNERYSLSGVVLLVGMVGKFPYITLRQMGNHHLEGDASFGCRLGNFLEKNPNVRQQSDAHMKTNPVHPEPFDRPVEG